MFFARIAAIAATASALLCGTAGAAGPLRPFQHGFWSGGAYIDDRTGVFTHCSAGVAYANGVNMFVLTTNRYRWWLGFIDPQWSLPATAEVPVQLRFENRIVIDEKATVPQGRPVLLVPLQDSPRALHALRRGSRLNLVVQDQSFLFKLRGTSAVINQLTRCVRTSVEIAEQETPSGQAGPEMGARPRAASEARPSSQTQPRSAPVTQRPPPQPGRIVSLWIWIAAGLLMGAVGQGIRAAIGLKKAMVNTTAPDRKLIESIEPVWLAISLLIGASAGAIAAVTASLLAGVPMSWPALLALGAAGYTGADFVEGLCGRPWASHARSRSRLAPNT